MSTPLIQYGHPLAVDVSDWQGTITDAELLTWRDLGIGRLIARSTSQDYARDILRRAGAVGFERELYIYLYWGRTGPAIIQAIGLAQEFNIHRLWLDCEDPFTDADSVREDIRQCVWDVGAEAIIPGIYAGKYWWQALGNPTEWAHLPLWMPNYGTGGWATPITHPGFGGWSDAGLVMHQCTSTPPGGIPRASLDLSYVYDATGGSMTPLERARLERLERLVAGWGFRGLTGEAALAEADTAEVSALGYGDNLNAAMTAHLVGHGAPSSHTHTGEVTVT